MCNFNFKFVISAQGLQVEISKCCYNLAQDISSCFNKFNVYCALSLFQINNFHSIPGFCQGILSQGSRTKIRHHSSSLFLNPEVMFLFSYLWGQWHQALFVQSVLLNLFQVWNVALKVRLTQGLKNIPGLSSVWQTLKGGQRSSFYMQKLYTCTIESSEALWKLHVRTRQISKSQIFVLG